MPVLRKTIDLTVSGNILLATDSVTSLSTSDAGVQGEDEAVLFHVTVPTDWQDLSVRLKAMSQDGGYDLSDLPVANVISMPLRQGLTMASGRLTVSLIGNTTDGVRKSVDCKTLIVVASAQEIDPISHIYPYPVHHITGSGGALVTQTDNDTYNVNVTGTGGDMLQANYASGSGQANTNKVDHAIYADSAGTAGSATTAGAAQAGSALETAINNKMTTATYATGTGVANTNKVDHSIFADGSTTAVNADAKLTAQEATWTAYTSAFSASGGGLSMGSTGTVVGAYKKIGKTVLWRATLTANGTGISAGTGTHSVSLPFAPVGTAPVTGYGLIYNGTFHMIMVYNLALYCCSSGAPVDNTSTNGGISAAGHAISINGSYETAS